jgi:outer membrane lipoprotein-sorting protein
MRTIFVSILGIFFLCFTAQLTVAQDQKAIKILNDSKSKMEGMADFTANFKYSVKAATRNAATKTGKIKYKKGKFRITLPDQEMICDKRKIWVYMKKDNEVNVSPYDKDSGIDIEQIFKTYQNSAKARYTGEESIGAIACHKIEIATTDKKLDYNQVKLWINTKTNFLEKATLVDRRQTATTYEFSNVKTNNGFTDKEFEFNTAKYPGVKVYDESN